MNIKISILVPVYNTEKYLRKCLDSLISQTIKDIEIIIVNDGSKDNSQSIIEEYANKDNRIKYFLQENRGLGATRNKGIEMANGEYIAFLDSDDWVEPNCYEELYRVAKLNDYDLVVSDYYIDYKSKSSVRTNNQENQDKNIYLQNLCLKHIDGFSWNKLYRKSIIDKNNLRFPVRGELENVEDQFFTIRYVNLSNSICFVNKPLIHYIIRSSSIVNTYQKNLIEDGIELYKSNCIFFKSYSLDNYIKVEESLNLGLLKHIVQVVDNEGKSSNNIKLKEKIQNIRSILKNSIYMSHLEDVKNKKISLNKLRKDEVLYIKLLISKRIYLLYFLAKIRNKSIERRMKLYE